MRTNRARREALDEALDRLVAGASPDDAGELTDVAGRARAALATQVPERTAARHIATATVRGQDTDIMSARRRPRRRALTIAIAVTALLAGSASSAVAASSSALPGEALYPVKKAVERVRLAAPGSASTKAKLHLEFADRRLSELQLLLAKREAGEDVNIGAAMSAYAAELAAAEADVVAAGEGRSDEEFLAHVHAQLERHVQRLEFIRDNKVPEQARAAIQRAIDNAERARERVGHGRLGEGPGRGKPDDTPGRGREGAPGQQRAPATPGP